MAVIAAHRTILKIATNTDNTLLFYQRQMNYSIRNFLQAEIKDLRMGKVITGSSHLPDAVYGQTMGQ